VGCGGSATPPAHSGGRTEPLAQRDDAGAPAVADSAPARPAVAPDSTQRDLAERYGAVAPLSRFRGDGSYYSDALAGRSTASGEPYQPRHFTAAHRSLPFGTVVRVVSEHDGKTAYVRINDRGPFVRGRVLDLSRAAAEELGFIKRGVGKVRVEVVEYGNRRKVSRKRRARHR